MKLRPRSTITSVGCPPSNRSAYLRQCSLGRSLNDFASVLTPQSPMEFWDTLKAKGETVGVLLPFLFHQHTSLETYVAKPRRRGKPNQGFYWKTLVFQWLTLFALEKKCITGASSPIGLPQMLNNAKEKKKNNQVTACLLSAKKTKQEEEMALSFNIAHIVHENRSLFQTGWCQSFGTTTV